MNATADKKRIRVTLVKGLRGAIHKHRECVKGLGLKHRQHTVEVAAFHIDRYKVTNGEYLEFVRAGGSPPVFWNNLPSVKWRKQLLGTRKNSASAKI